MCGTGGLQCKHLLIGELIGGRGIAAKHPCSHASKHFQYPISTALVKLGCV